MRLKLFAGAFNIHNATVYCKAKYGIWYTCTLHTLAGSCDNGCRVSRSHGTIKFRLLSVQTLSPEAESKHACGNAEAAAEALCTI